MNFSYIATVEAPCVDVKKWALTKEDIEDDAWDGAGSTADNITLLMQSLSKVPLKKKWNFMRYLFESIKILTLNMPEKTVIRIMVTVYDRCGEFPPMSATLKDTMRSHGIILPWEKHSFTNMEDFGIRPNPDFTKIEDDPGTL